MYDLLVTKRDGGDKNVIIDVPVHDSAPTYTFSTRTVLLLTLLVPTAVPTAAAFGVDDSSASTLLVFAGCYGCLTCAWIVGLVLKRRSFNVALTAHPDSPEDGKAEFWSTTAPKEQGAY